MFISDKKILGKTLGLSGPTGHESADLRPILAANQNLKFQKYTIFFAILVQIVNSQTLIFFSEVDQLQNFF